MSDIEIAGLEELQLVEAGGFGLVYRAYQPHFERTVAVKVLQTRVTDDHLQHQFRRECAAAGRLTGHPHIVTVFDAGFTSEGRPYLVMEWMSGGSLEDHLRSKGPLGPRAVVTIGVKVADALGAAHADGVLHRDVKPANILISRFGEPELADFGIASLGTATGMSQSMYALTPVHSAPEVLNGTKATTAADIYGLASTLWTLLTGEAPFAGPTDEAVVPMVMRILRSEVPVLDRPDVPPALAAALAEAMAKAPEDRPATAAVFADRLTAALDSPPPAVPSGTRPKPTTAPVEAITTESHSPLPNPPEHGLGDVTEIVDLGDSGPAAKSGRRRTRAAVAAGVAMLVLALGAFLLWRFAGGVGSTETIPTNTEAGADAQPPWPPPVGSCLSDEDPAPGSYEPKSVPCDEAHESEVANVFLVAEPRGTPYPGEDALRDGTYTSPCTPAVYATYLGVPVAERPELVTREILPDAKSWASGKATFICVLEHLGGGSTVGRVVG